MSENERPVSHGILKEATEATPSGYARSGFTHEAGATEGLYRLAAEGPPDGAICWASARRHVMTAPTFNAPDGYEPLARILADALMQAAKGKGRERHAQGGQPFAEQPMQAITGMVGLGFTTGQAIKKTQEAAGMAARGETDAAKRELLGAIVYAAGAVLALEGKA